MPTDGRIFSTLSLRGQFCHESYCSIRIQRFRHSAIAKTFSCQHRIQASSTNEQSKQAIQDGYVCFTVFVSILTMLIILRASLPVIVSLLSLWIILFIFFAILFVEVFGMTKWNSAETRNQNYSTMGSALVMLAFMSTG